MGDAPERKRFQRLRLTRPGRTWVPVSRERDWPPRPPVVHETVGGSGLVSRYMVPSTPGARHRIRWQRRAMLASALLGLVLWAVVAVVR